MGEQPESNENPRGALDEVLAQFQQSRNESRRKSVLEIGRRLLKLIEFQNPERLVKIGDSREKAEQYQRGALRAAVKSLDAAYNALSIELPDSLELNAEQVRSTITALQDTAWWDDLLTARTVFNIEASRAASRSLAEGIASLQSDKITSDSLLRLLVDVDLLRREIDFASRRAALLSPGAVRQYVGAAYSVASQVMVGLVATSATAAVAGLEVAPQVIYTAVGLTVASSLAEIYRRSSRAIKVRTVTAQLQKYHHELIEALGDLIVFMSWLEMPSLPSEDAINTVRSTCLAAGFLVSHVEQLALSFTWPKCIEYCHTLHEIKGILNLIHQNIIIEQRYQDIQNASNELDNASSRLQGFSRYVDVLGLDRRFRALPMSVDVCTCSDDNVSLPSRVQNRWICNSLDLGLSRLSIAPVRRYATSSQGRWLG